MGVAIKYFFGIPGNYDVIDPAFILTDILCVTRSGTVYHDGSPAEGLTFSYQNALGRILFGHPFAGPTTGDRIDRTALERISVKYKT